MKFRYYVCSRYNQIIIYDSFVISDATRDEVFQYCSFAIRIPWESSPNFGNNLRHCCNMSLEFTVGLEECQSCEAVKTNGFRRNSLAQNICGHRIFEKSEHFILFVETIKLARFFSSQLSSFPIVEISGALWTSRQNTDEGRIRRRLCVALFRIVLGILVDNQWLRSSILLSV